MNQPQVSLCIKGGRCAPALPKEQIQKYKIQNTKIQKYKNTKIQKKGKVALRRREMARRAVKMAMDALDLGRVSFDHLLVTQPRIAQSREIHKDKNTQLH